MTYLRKISARITPQSEALPGQVPNNAGGNAWALDDWGRLDRFLILGAEAGTYYVGGRDLLKQNTDALKRCIATDGRRTVDRIVEISSAGRAPSNDPAIFALAVTAAYGDPSTKRLAFGALPEVCRIGTHLLHFASYAQGFRGWGRALRDAVASWYLTKEPDDLVYQVMKYRDRDGWTHRDLLRLSHPHTQDEVLNEILRWIVKGEASEQVPAQLHAFEALQRAEPGNAAGIIRDHRLPRECVPTELLVRPDVWEALLEDMPMLAMVRNLATMTRIGLVAPMSEGTRTVLQRLSADGVRAAKVHPLALLLALKTYASGHGLRGNATWDPVPQVIDTLDGAFEQAFGNVPPTHKRWLLGLDVSGSMGSPIAGKPLSAREGAAALAMVTARTEPWYATMAFQDRFVRLPIAAKQRLDDVVRMTSGLSFGRTDCALPMLWALEQKLPIDVFAVYTDNETWAGQVHPAQALQQYRERMGIDAKLIVLGMTATEFTIADPADAGMLDVVGFDAAVPEVMADFVKG